MWLCEGDAGVAAVGGSAFVRGFTLACLLVFFVQLLPELTLAVRKWSEGRTGRDFSTRRT